MSGRSEGGGGGRLGALCGVSIAPHLQWVSEPPVGTLLGRLGAAGGLGEVPWDHSNIPPPPQHVRLHLIPAGSRLPIISAALPLISVPPLPSMPTALPHFLK